MGNTIRREPVTFDIPKSPDYRHLNITNFRGLDVSSNPFELDNNTASDCLNVYVDESNTLTTRPRLQNKYPNLLEILGESWEPIGYYRLHNGYLLHGKLLSGKYVMKKFVDGNITDITGAIPTNKCKVFEQGNEIYLLDGVSYFKIKDSEINLVDGYIPTAYVTDATGEKREVEPLNLLSQFYKEKLYWDATWNPKKYSKNTVDAVNETVVNTIIDTNTFKPVKKLNQKSTIAYDYWYGINTRTKKTAVATIDKKTNEIINLIDDSYDLTGYQVITCDITPDGNHKYVVVKSTNSETYYVYWSYYDIWTLTQLNDYNTSEAGMVSEMPQTFLLSYNRIYYWFGATRVYTSSLGWIDVTQNAGENANIASIAINNDASIILVYTHDKDDIFLNNRLLVYRYSPDSGFTFTEIIDTNFSPILDFAFSQDGNDLLVAVQSGTREKGYTDLYYYSDIRNEGIKNVTQITHTTTGYLTKIVMDDDLIYATNGDQLLIINKTSLSVVWEQRIGLNMLLLSGADKHINVTKSAIEIPNIDSDNHNIIWTMVIDDGNFVTLTEKIIDNQDWQDKRQLLFKSYLNTRFDNNYWFAIGNRYYRSRNNDPTYFPITEYNDLGDSNLPITGFNLANDTTLIAYKDDRLYLIQPFESSSGSREYSITESKNTVGNTAIDAPIVTTLTEIPLQINNDGVYGLSQLSNVSATERIADLMSRPINQRWLDIPDDIIKNAQTLNRLYWTYIILPDEAKNKTSIYLLDNRTNSWYYWELPIVVLDSFVVDNRTEFADKNGEIYYLTTTDIDVPNFEDVLITEYYDDGEKLIDWYWQSQIMYLGTINYTKRLVNTTFILTDDDTTDGYGLKYGFKVFRKLASSVPDKEISNDINLVRSTTRKTNISKFGFLQMKISNITPDDRGTEERKEFRNNKLRLVGLGLKYVLLEGLIR